ncbi:MAG: DUF3426 domain-containing protein [Proteobacteria bacterium]|nr:DUF3426 domain-containing protein [Pseudomonadota bacterium]
MRLVTRCPTCATTFKVVRDQLRISDGWVRCGRCSEVFDATLDLQETDDDGVPLSAGAPQGPAQPVPAHSPQEVRQPPASGNGLPAMTWPAADLLDLGAKPAAAAAVASAPAPVRSPPVMTPYSEADDPVPIPSLGADDDDGAKEPWLDEMMASTQALQAAFQSAATTATPDVAGAATEGANRKDPAFIPSLTAASPIEEAVNAQVQKALRRERVKALRLERAQKKELERAQQDGAAKDEAPAHEDAPAPEAQAALPETPLLEAPSAPASFVDDPADGAVRPNRTRKILLALACVLALLVLLLQVAREERNSLAAREPRLRPALEALCGWTGCQVSALRQINSITIEGASFSREKEGEGYRLVFALRNGARVPLAMPSIELTLLDTQERALVRRVLSPAQFGAGPVLGPGAESSTSLPVQLSGSEAAGLGPVAGYNLVAFYP